MSALIFTLPVRSSIPRRLERQRRITARRLRDRVLHGQTIVVIAACRLHGRRRAAVQGVFDALHIDERVRRRFTAREVSDDDITGVDQPLACLARRRRSIDASRDLHLRARGLDRAARTRARTACRDLPRKLGHAVRPYGDHAARAALCRCIRTYSRTALNPDVLRVRKIARTLPAAADLDRAADCAAHVRHASCRKMHIVRRHANRTRRPVKARGTDDALLIDRRARQCITRRCRHENEASVRFDETFICDCLFQCRRGRHNRNLAISVKINRHGFTRRKHRCALARNNDALIHDILAEQGDRSLILSDERGTIDNFSVIRCADKGVFARHKIGICNIHRRCKNRAGIHLSTGCKENARRIHKKDATVRRERTEDLGRVISDHTIEECRLCARLEDVHALVRRDIERIPVDDGALRRLTNRHLRLRLRDLCRPRCDRSSLRQGVSLLRTTDHQCTCRQNAYTTVQTFPQHTATLFPHHAHSNTPSSKTLNPYCVTVYIFIILLHSEEFINLKPESPAAVRI